MDETHLRRAMGQLTIDEPQYVIASDEAVTRGRQARRRHTTRTSALASVSTVAVVAAGVGFAHLAWGPSSTETPTAAGNSMASTAGAPTPASTAAADDSGASTPQTASSKALSALYADTRAAAIGASPAGIDFSGWNVTSATPVAGGNEFTYGVDGNVNDGKGAARLSITLMPAGEPSAVYSNACVDAGFVDDSPCDSAPFGADGSTITLRGLSHDPGGYAQVNVVIWHPDGSAVIAEADNGAIDTSVPPTAGFSDGAAKKAATDLTITRATPVFSVDQLATIAKAVDSEALPETASAGPSLPKASATS